MPAVSALHSGGIVAFPTETFYGLAVDPRSALAVRRIFALKQRAPDQPLPLIAGEHRADRRSRRHDDAARPASRVARVARPTHADHSCVPSFVRRRAPLHGPRGRARVCRSRGAGAGAERRSRHHVYQRESLRRSASRNAGARRGVVRRRHRRAHRCGCDARRTSVDDRRRDGRHAGTRSRRGVPWERVLEFSQ